MANCWSATRDPLIPGEASSELYCQASESVASTMYAGAERTMGTRADKAPTARPATARPAQTRLKDVVAAVCKAVPTMKMMHQPEMLYFLLNLSARGPVARAPIYQFKGEP